MIKLEYQEKNNQGKNKFNHQVLTLSKQRLSSVFNIPVILQAVGTLALLTHPSAPGDSLCYHLLATRTI